MYNIQRAYTKAQPAESRYQSPDHLRCTSSHKSVELTVTTGICTHQTRPASEDDRSTDLPSRNFYAYHVKNKRSGSAVPRIQPAGQPADQYHVTQRHVVLRCNAMAMATVIPRCSALCSALVLSCSQLPTNQPSLVPSEQAQRCIR